MSCKPNAQTIVIAALATLALALAHPRAAAHVESPRKPNPLAPSLPQLTDEEEEELDRIVEGFIQADLGKLRGDEAKKATRAFQHLGPESFFALIRGFNRAANIEGSCPAVVIGKKLATVLQTTRDHDLLDFARENIGLGVTQSRHQAVLKELRLSAALRKGQLGPKPRTPPVMVTAGPKTLRSMSIGELAEAAGSERGPKQKQVILELGQRGGPEAVAALGSAATSYEGEIQQLARDWLYRNLVKESPLILKRYLKDDRAAVRATAAQVAGNKGVRVEDELIELLDDPEAEVCQAARQALVRLSRGQDFGPAKDASAADRAAAMRQWRAWWTKQGGR